MRVETFWSYKKYIWLWLNLFLMTFLSLIYLFHAPFGGHRGNTFYGYLLGSLATAGILWLMWYGIRKRSYHSSKTTLKGWLAGHVGLGLTLQLMVPLHSGFSLGANLHSLAYLLMVIVILSGIWGAVNYQALANKIQSHRGGGGVAQLMEQLHIFELGIAKLCITKSDSFLQLRDRLEIKNRTSLWQWLFIPISEGVGNSDITATISALPEIERDEALKLVTLCEKRRQMARRLQEELQTTAKLKLWLLIHLPFSIGLLVMVFIHIFTVFYYR